MEEMGEEEGEGDEQLFEGEAIVLSLLCTLLSPPLAKAQRTTEDRSFQGSFRSSIR